jgi:hypothetical protein
MDVLDLDWSRKSRPPGLLIKLLSEFFSTNTKFQATRIESDDDDEVIPATPVDKGGRHRVKKMKKKTYQVNFRIFLTFPR